MNFYCYIDKGENIDELKTRLASHFKMVKFTFIEKECDFSNASWQLQPSNKALQELDRVRVSLDVSSIQKGYGNQVDIVAYFVSEKNWDGLAKGSTGWLYGLEYQRGDYFVMEVKMRDDWTDTAVHELMHIVNDYIYMETGVKLSTVFGVKDFDNDVVHGEGRNTRYGDYDYSDDIPTLEPYLVSAELMRRKPQADEKAQLQAKYENLLQQAVKLGRKVVLAYQNKIRNITASPSEKVLAAAKAYLGTDPTPQDAIDDVVACADSCTAVLHSVDARIPSIPGTYTLYEYLRDSALFIERYAPKPGMVIISPTGTGNGSMKGHVGIVGTDGQIYSNNSLDGKWETKYTLTSWWTRYEIKGGIPTHYFEYVG